MSKKENIITIVLFAAVILVGTILFVLIPDKKFSDNENRYLEELPVFETEDIKTGEFMEKWETYVADQFPGRDIFMLCGGRYKYLLGMRDINGVYTGKDGYLFTVIDKNSLDFEQIGKNSQYINDFLVKCEKSDNVQNTAFMLVPEAGMILSDKLPYGVDNSWQWELTENIRNSITNSVVIYPERSMEKSGEQLYYRTDHHWTGYGALCAYEAYCEALQIECEKTGLVEVSKDFYGSLYSKIMYADIPDKVVIADGKNDIAIKGDGKAGLLYDYTMLSKKDKYLVHQGGNYGMAEIPGNGEGTLLIIKDSFANSFVPFLTENYARIIMIDMRYYMGSPVILCNKEKVTDVLVLYSLSNFITDENMIKLGL